MSCWNVIKSDIMAAIQAIWNRNFDNIDKLNSAYIALIPKKEGVDHVKDFRPISIVHSFGKLITKILANRLASKLNGMISPNQSAFIKGWFIQDNFMLAQRTSRFLHRQKKASLLLILDITKAFDSVSWPFLIEVLTQHGFGQIWRDIICGLLASSSTQVLLNGFLGRRITHRRGLRQGDSLSLMLFILVMDILALLFNRAEESGLLQYLSGRVKLHQISMYDDDVVLFLSPSAVDISIALSILDLFGKASGLRNNEQKSNIFPIWCSTDDLLLVQNLLPCERSDFPCKYLVIPLSLHKLTKEQVQSIIDRVADCLPSWKADLMTRAGRKIMVQHVLTSMIVYLAMAIDFPPWALEAVDKIRKGFL
jgi:hypothetical protein